MVWAETCSIGCGVAFCPFVRYYSAPDVYLLICNYGPGYDNLLLYYKSTSLHIVFLVLIKEMVKFMFIIVGGTSSKMFMIHPMKLEDTAVMTARMDMNVPTVVFVSVVRKLA